MLNSLSWYLGISKRRHWSSYHRSHPVSNGVGHDRVGNSVGNGGDGMGHRVGNGGGSMDQRGGMDNRTGDGMGDRMSDAMGDRVSDAVGQRVGHHSTSPMESVRRVRD